MERDAGLAIETLSMRMVMGDVVEAWKLGQEAPVERVALMKESLSHYLDPRGLRRPHGMSVKKTLQAVAYGFDGTALRAAVERLPDVGRDEVMPFLDKAQVALSILQGRCMRGT